MGSILHPNRVIAVLAAVVVTVTMTVGVSAQVAGDDCWIPLAAYDGANAFDTTKATPSQPQPDESQCKDTFLEWADSPDIWFAYEAAVNGICTFTTCDVESYDTSMVVYEGSCQKQVACNGDSTSKGKCQLYYSEITIPITAGETYFIRIGGWQGATGYGTMTITAKGSGSTTWLVDADAASGGDGSDWASAFDDLQDALGSASGGDEIWVAEGTYTPAAPGGDRDKSFLLELDGLAVYGGFAGDETSADERNPYAHPTILSGDLNGDDGADFANYDENSLHVVKIQNVDESTVLDGFTIAHGNANGEKWETNGSGGGLSNVNGAPTLVRLRFLENQAASTGGGMFDNMGGAALSRCNFESNRSGVWGGGLYLHLCSEYWGAADSQITDCLFLANMSEAWGGGISMTDSVPVVTNCIFSSNEAGSGGGAQHMFAEPTFINCTFVHNTAVFGGGMLRTGGDSLKIRNSIFWGNTDSNGNDESAQLRVDGTTDLDYCCIQGWTGNWGGQNVTGEDPRFMNPVGSDGVPGTGDENFALLQLSACIDAGDNNAVPEGVTTDFVGNNRFVDDPYTTDTGSGAAPIVDLGAHEHRPNQSGQPGIKICILSGSDSGVFGEEDNWVPEAPGSSDGAWLDWAGNYAATPTLLHFEENIVNKNMTVASGWFALKLAGHTYEVTSSNPASLIIAPFANEGAALNLSNGTLVANRIVIGGAEPGGGLWVNPQATVFATGGIVLLEYGSLGGGGVSNIFTNLGNLNGRLEPQSAESSTGLLSINGDYAQEGTLPNGTPSSGALVMDIAGSIPGEEHDQLDVTGDVILGGSLVLNWDEDLGVDPGDTFAIISAGTSQGAFQAIWSKGLPADRATQFTMTAGMRGGGVGVGEAGPITFDAPQSTAISGEPAGIVVADLDGINGPDVIVTIPDASTENEGTVVILLNNGTTDGAWDGFTEVATRPTVGKDPRGIDAADFNNDGDIDLAVANAASHDVTVLVNEGGLAARGLTFTRIDVIVDDDGEAIEDSMPVDVAAGEFLDGGSIDLMVSCPGDSKVVTLKNTTTGVRGTSFTIDGSNVLPNAPGPIDPGDINEDKDLDTAVLSPGGGNVSILEGNSSGGSGMVGWPIPAGDDPVDLKLGDLDGDEYIDMVIANEGDGTVSVLLHSGSGSNYVATADIPVADAVHAVVLADFDNVPAVRGADDLDLAAVVTDDFDEDGSSETGLIIARNDTESSGTVVFSQDEDAYVTDGSPTLLATGDFDEDGRVDLVVVTDDYSGGTTRAITVLLNTTTAVSTCPADVNDDGDVNVNDLLAVIAAWGDSGGAADVNEDGTVDVSDLLEVIAAWGPCE